MLLQDAKELEVETPQSSVKLKFDICSAADTKAVKSDWEEGDNIYLFFQENTDPMCNNTLCAVITYDGGDWVVASPADQTQVDSITESGRVFAQYIAGPRREFKKIGGITPRIEYNPAEASSLAFGEIQEGRGDYTLEDDVISATIMLDQLCSQITVSGLDAEDSWIMESPADKEYTQLSGVYKMGVQWVDAKTGLGAVHTSFESPMMYGVANDDGVAFYALRIDSAEQPIKLILRQEGSPISYKRSFKGRHFEMGKAYMIKGPQIDESGNLTDANGWEINIESNKIVFTVTSDEDPFPIAGITSDNFGANLAKLVYYKAEAYGEIIFDGPITKIGASVFKNNTSLTGITLPNGVTSIEDEAFSGCSNLAKVILPESVASIGVDAFLATPWFDNKPSEGLWCDRGNVVRGYVGEMPDTIVIPDGMVSIGEKAFYSRSDLASITIPESVTTICNSAFNRCGNLTSITIPESVISIGDNAFIFCVRLSNVDIRNAEASIGVDAFMYTPWYDNKPSDGLWCDRGNLVRGYVGDMPANASIVIPDGMVGIWDRAFENCKNLVSITIPESIMSIGRYAFANCSSLASVSIPRGVTNIENYTFEGCSALTSVSIPDGVTSIGLYAFKACSSLTSVSIPSGVTQIANNTFRECTSLSSVTIPETVTSIDDYAFAYCTSLSSINIPETVASINVAAFTHCSSLTIINIPSDVNYIAASTFDGCSALTTVTMPAGVTTIAEKAFRGCKSLTSIKIPAGVTLIQRDAFKDCSGLDFVFCAPVNPPIIVNQAIPDNCSFICVPRASVDRYKTDKSWSVYAGKIRPYDY